MELRQNKSSGSAFVCAKECEQNKIEWRRPCMNAWEDKTKDQAI